MRDLTLRQVEVIRAVHDDRHHPGRGRVPQRLGAGDQPAGQAHRGEPRRPALRAQGRPLRAGRRGRAGLRADPPDLREDGRPLLSRSTGSSAARSPSSPSPRCRRSRSSSPPAPSMQVRRRFPELYIDLNVLKIEETVDYLLLERGEFVARATASTIPRSTSARSARASSSSILPEDHRLAGAPRALGARDRRRAADRRRRQRPLRRDHRPAVRAPPACRAGSRSRPASPRPWSAWCATASASRSSTSSRSPASTCPAWRACRSPSRSEIAIYVAAEGRPRACRATPTTPSTACATSCAEAVATGPGRWRLINIRLREAKSRYLTLGRPADLAASTGEAAPTPPAMGGRPRSRRARTLPIIEDGCVRCAAGAAASSAATRPLAPAALPRAAPCAPPTNSNRRRPRHDRPRQTTSPPAGTSRGRPPPAAGSARRSNTTTSSSTRPPRR